MSTDEALALTGSGIVELDDQDYNFIRMELIDSMQRRMGMSKDLRCPNYVRNAMRTKAESIYRIYVKVGGTLSFKEISA